MKNDINPVSVGADYGLIVRESTPREVWRLAMIFCPRKARKYWEVMDLRPRSSRKKNKTQ